MLDRDEYFTGATVRTRDHQPTAYAGLTVQSCVLQVVSSVLRRAFLTEQSQFCLQFDAAFVVQLVINAGYCEKMSELLEDHGRRSCSHIDHEFYPIIYSVQIRK